MSWFHDDASRQAGYLDRDQALRAGLTQDEIQYLVGAHHWQRPQRGVYLTGSAPPDWEGSVRAACLAAGGDARAMGRTAARLHGFDGASGFSVIEIAVSYTRGPIPQAVLVHRTRRAEPDLTTSVRGVRVSSINETLRECAWLIRADPPVERMVEHALLRGKTSEGSIRR